jgi:hypothetical protein
MGGFEGLSTPTSSSSRQAATRGGVGPHRPRRPTGAPPPLPHRLQTSGVGWLVAAVVLVGLALAVFARGLRGPAVAVTVVDDAVVRWVGMQTAGLGRVWRGLAGLTSWWVLFTLMVALPVVLIAMRRWRHLVLWLIGWQFLLIVFVAVARTARRPRPFGVTIGSSWGGWALPSMQLSFFAALLVGLLYGLVPEGRWRNTGKWLAAVLVGLAAAARVALGTDAPTDVLLGMGIGVAIPLVAFRRFVPNEVFPVSYRRGRTAHLDVSGPRGRPSAERCRTSSAWL